MSYTQRFTEWFEPLANISPQAANGVVGVHNSGFVFVGNYHRIIVLLHIGEPAGASTIDVDVEEATTAAGAGTVNIAGKSIATIVAAGAGSIVAIELRTEEMNVANDFDWINVEVTVGVAAYTYSLYVFGFEPRFPPVPVTAWQEIVP